MKKIILLFLSLFFLYNFSFAQTSTGDNENSTGENKSQCISGKYNIQGNFELEKGDSGNFKIISKENIPSPLYERVVYKLYKDDKQISIHTGSNFNYKFNKLGNYTLEVNILEKNGCKFLINKDINIYSDIIVYIGESFENFGEGIGGNFKKEDIFLKKIYIKNKGFFSKDTILQLISDNLYYIKNTSKIIINDPDFSTIFEILGDIASLYDISLLSKDIYLVTDVNQNFLNRILAKYTKVIGTKKIFVVERDKFLNFLFSIGSESNEKYYDIFSVSFQDVSKLLFFSYVVDYLIYNGFPNKLLTLILTLSVAVLLISIFRQIIGFSVFGVYNPLLFAVSFVVLGIKFSFALLFIAFISTFLVRLFTKKVYLLYSAKISFLMIIYFLVTLIFLWFDKIIGFQFIDYDLFKNSFIIFPIVFVVMLGNKVFHEGFSLFSKGWWFYFFEFLIVTFTIYFLITWQSFQNLLLSYPEIIILVLIANIFVGRFTGLQLLEYFRFNPLIKRMGDEE